MAIDKLLFAPTLITALGSGLIAGVFFIFSVAIMRSLERVPGGMAAMQSINVVIVNPMFLAVFMGTAVLCLVLAIGSALSWQGPGSTWIVCGALLYLIGSFGVTAVFNIPMNNALMAADPATPSGQEVWKNYLVNWTFWNHVRTIATLGSSASFIMGLTYFTGR